MEFKDVSKKPRERQIIRGVVRMIFKNDMYYTQDGKTVIATGYVEGWTEDEASPLPRKKEREKAINETREDARLIKD